MIVRRGIVSIGNTYRITHGYYKGKLIKIDYIPRIKAMNCSGVLLHNGKTTNVQHADLAIVADTAQDRETLIRKTVQKMLKAGNFTAAKKLLATLSKNN